MRGLKNVSIAGIFLTLILSNASADRGDIFLAGMAIAEPGEASAFGGGASLSIGANEQTDFQFELDWTAQAEDFDKDQNTAMRYMFGSFFTPYFGEIRPRFGGSLGIVHAQNSHNLNSVQFNSGLHLQGLYEVNSNLRLISEVNPGITVGASGGGFSTLFKLGIQFRLSK